MAGEQTGIERVEHRGILGQWNNCVYYKDEHTSVDIYPDPENLQHQVSPNLNFGH